jgi:uncharacterized protein (UPF0332 family)
MDAAEQQRRWETAEGHRRAAYKLSDEGLFQASASRSYYACYQAMWVAVGDPPKGQWRHAGLIQHFCLGRWATPILLPTSLGPLYRQLLELYEYRLKADYSAVPIKQAQAQKGLDTMEEVFRLVQQHKPTVP